jgi:hypothetical protein
LAWRPAWCRRPRGVASTATAPPSEEPEARATGEGDADGAGGLTEQEDGGRGWRTEMAAAGKWRRVVGGSRGFYTREARV